MINHMQCTIKKYMPKFKCYETLEVEISRVLSITRDRAEGSLGFCPLSYSQGLPPLVACTADHPLHQEEALYRWDNKKSRSKKI